MPPIKSTLAVPIPSSRAACRAGAEERCAPRRPGGGARSPGCLRPAQLAGALTWLGGPAALFVARILRWRESVCPSAAACCDSARALRSAHCRWVASTYARRAVREAGRGGMGVAGLPSAPLSCAVWPHPPVVACGRRQGPSPRPASSARSQRRRAAPGMPSMGYVARPSATRGRTTSYMAAATTSFPAPRICIQS